MNFHEKQILFALMIALGFFICIVGDEHPLFDIAFWLFGYYFKLKLVVGGAMVVLGFVLSSIFSSCPYCKERVRGKFAKVLWAKRCQHCGEFLD